MPLKERKGYEKNIDNNAFFLMIKKKMKNTYFKYYFSVYLFIIQLEFQTFSLPKHTINHTMLRPNNANKRKRVVWIKNSINKVKIILKSCVLKATKKLTNISKSIEKLLVRLIFNMIFIIFRFMFFLVKNLIGLHNFI